jgi:hypothetical protein
VTFASPNRKAAWELEKVQSQRIAALPLSEDPLRDLQSKPSQCSLFVDGMKRSFLGTVVSVHDPSKFSTSRYHLEEHLVAKEDDQQVRRETDDR